MRLRLRRLRRDLRARLKLAETNALWRARRARQRPHPLKAEVVVSLTSYPPRYPVLAPTLRCLLSQTLRPDRVVLWIAEGEDLSLPKEVLDLQADGLTIRPAKNTRSFKKIIPALREWPGAYIATADDDTYYWPTWLEEMIQAHLERPDDVVCHRAHLIATRDGQPLPYNDWRANLAKPTRSPLVFPTGVGGVFYPPGSLDSEVLNEAFMRLCPTGDDIWLWWMARRAGFGSSKLGLTPSILLWPSSQTVSLYAANARHGDENDRQIQAMIEAYGWPVAETVDA